MTSGSYRLRPSITMGYFSSWREARQIEVGEFLPLGEDQQGIRAVSRFVRRLANFMPECVSFLSAFHGRRIIGGDLAAFLH